MPRSNEIGRVRTVNPARREARVVPRRGYAGAFAGRGTMEFGLNGGKRVTFAVATVEEQDRYVKLTLAAEVSPDDVASLRGATVYAEAERATPDDPFEVAAQEFADFAVRGPDGAEVGVVAGGFNTAAHGVIEIVRTDGTTVLAPFVAEVVAEVDFDARTIVLRDVEAHMVEQDSDGTMA